MERQVISKAVDRSATFEQSLLQAFHLAEVRPSPSVLLASELQQLSIMHAGAVRSLALDHPLSAFALLRPQVEACIRGIWVLHAGDDFAEAFTRELAEDGIEPQFPKRVERLLDDLEASSRFAAHARSLRDYWSDFGLAFHGYTHGGRISLQLVSGKVETVRMTDALAHSRGLLGIAYVLLQDCVECSQEERQPLLRLVSNAIAEPAAPISDQEPARP